MNISVFLKKLISTLLLFYFGDFTTHKRCIRPDQIYKSQGSSEANQDCMWLHISHVLHDVDFYL